MRKVRKERRLSQAEMAEALGIASNYYSRLERGENAPKKTLALLFCREFGVNPDWLLHGKGEMNVGPAERVVRMQRYEDGRKESGPGQRMIVREAAPAWPGASKPPPRKWRERLAKMIASDEEKIEYAIRELKVPLPQVLAELGQRIVEEDGQCE